MKKILTVCLILGVFLFSPHAADAANWKAYTIVDYLDGYPRKLLVSDGVHEYIVQVDYSSYTNYYDFSASDEGQVILIDTVSTPSFYDDVYYDPPYTSPVLMYIINFPDQLNLYSLYVVDDDWLSNRAIVRSGSQQYIIDYSSGCFSLPEGQYISIDSPSGYMSAFADLYDFTGSYSYETCFILDYSIVPSVVPPPVTTTPASPSTVSDSTTNTVTARESVPVEPKKVQKLAIKTEKKKRTLSWKKTSGATKYTVEVYKKSGKKWIKVSTKKTSKTKESYNSLKKGNYKFRVKGLNGSTSGGWSAWKTFSVK